METDFSKAAVQKKQNQNKLVNLYKWLPGI